MKRLKTLLQSKYFWIILTLFISIWMLYYFTKDYQSIYKVTDTKFIGKVEKMKETEENIEITIKFQDEILKGCIKKIDGFPNLELNDLIKIQGTLQEILPNTNFYQFNYQEYSRRKKQYYTLKIETVEILEKNQNIFYKLKNKLIKRVNSFNNEQVKSYLYAFILGDTSYLKDDVIESYRNNGVAHLLAVSGMHVSFLMTIIYTFLKKIGLSEEVKLFVSILFLSIYSFFIGFTPSVLRSSIFFILTKANSIFKLEQTPLKIFIIVLFLVLWINPYNLYEVGFQYSFLISFILILFSKILKEKNNYITNLLNVSFLAFVSSLPITIYNFHQINLLGIIYNLFFVPFVSFIIFPFSFVVLICPSISKIYTLLLDLLEIISKRCDSISVGTLIMRHPKGFIFLLLIIFWFIVLYLYYKCKKIAILLFISGLFLYCNINIFLNENTINILDVGQGDSILLQFQNKSVLIDTGGSFSYDLATRTIIPFLKAKGIHQINTLILTHGDYDHMGEATNIVNNFKVEKVIFNCGEFNDLEQELITVLDKKKIEYYSCIKELNVDDNKLYFLNNKDYGNENDNSSVIYTELNKHKFLFMGDAGIEVEEDLIEKYNLQNIDILKVGHHGSRTSSSKEFIDEVDPKYSIISVGENNRYGHPNKEVLDNLKESKIYRTDLDGSIRFEIKNNKLEIETCTP